MALRIGVVSQKGGVGKSTLARLIACEYARAQWRVKIADLDLSQGTSYNWQSRRLQQGIHPEIAVEQFATIDQALRVADAYDLMVFDGAPHATQTTLQISQHCQLVLLPTGISLDDLEPTIRLAHELKHHSVPVSKIAVVLCRVGDSESEIQEARAYIQAAGYTLLEGAIPERTAYRRASDLGRTVTETPYRSLNEKADTVMQAIVDCLEQLETNGGPHGNHQKPKTDKRHTPTRQSTESQLDEKGSA